MKKILRMKQKKSFSEEHFFKVSLYKLLMIKPSRSSKVDLAQALPSQRMISVKKNNKKLMKI